MITDLDLVLACQATYSGAPPTWTTDVTHAYLSVVNGVWVFAWEGTTDLAEWAVDFEAIPVDERGFNHDALGWVHKGWWDDVDSLAKPMLAQAHSIQAQGQRMACTGHSKGAGEALIFAALAATDGIKWDRVSTFGTPHPGALNGLVTSAIGCDYRNRSDPVCDVPWYLGRPRPLTEVKSEPAPSIADPWGPLRDHHIAEYVAAMRGKEIAP